jgi:hypothetical protein
VRHAATITTKALYPATKACCNAINCIMHNLHLDTKTDINIQNTKQISAQLPNRNLRISLHTTVQSSNSHKHIVHLPLSTSITFPNTQRKNRHRNHTAAFYSPACSIHDNTGRNQQPNQQHNARLTPKQPHPSLNPHPRWLPSIHVPTSKQRRKQCALLYQSSIPHSTRTKHCE